MFKLTLFLLLCTAIISVRTLDLFNDCVWDADKIKEPYRCMFIPLEEVYAYIPYYIRLAEAVLQQHANQLSPKYLNTFYNVTRVAVKNRGQLQVGATLLMEFMTTQSTCFRQCHFSVFICPPNDNKVNGVCRASFYLRSGVFIVEQSWCHPLESATPPSKPESSSVTP
ncbi:uncharacterized protein LOC119168009 [Rhipicephalus microplus]|uniref:uncharacterized protein LOC119168009 n=1 Tax=Rhipicephalus microplus TaxID=6941 RepID=UPI003F6A8ABE